MDEDYISCNACKLEFLSDTDDDLCPECYSSMEEGLTKILLSKGDCALVLREEGIDEIYMGNKPEHELASNSELIIVALAKKLQSLDFLIDIINELEEDLKKIED